MPTPSPHPTSSAAAGVQPRSSVATNATRWRANVTTILLAAPLVARPSRLAPIFRDATIPFLFAWLAIATASTALGVSTYFDEPYVRYEREMFLSHNVTQVLNVSLMVAQYVVLICALRAISFAQLRWLIALFIAVGAVGAVYSL